MGHNPPQPPSENPVRALDTLLTHARVILFSRCVPIRSLLLIMMSKTVVALALLEQVNAFSAPVVRARQVQMFSEGDIGVLPPLGVYDPLGLIETRNMARYEIMEIKHGRAAMLGFLHVILVEAGAKIPTEECLAAPTGMIASLESMPTFGWLQIMLFCCMQETGAGNESSFFALAKAQTVDSEAGDIAGIGWVRYDDPETKTFKLNAERQNGRAAMLGITGCLIHELLGVDALYPTGGLGGAAPPTIF